MTVALDAKAERVVQNSQYCYQFVVFCLLWSHHRLYFSKRAPTVQKQYFEVSNRFIDGLRRVQKQLKTCMLGDRVP